MRHEEKISEELEKEIGKRDHILFLQDILEAAERIEKYTQGMSYEEFLKDQKTKDAVLRNLGIIDEAAKNVPQEIRERCPQLDWKRISQIRENSIGDYFNVDYSLIWQTLKELPDSTQIKLER